MARKKSSRSPFKFLLLTTSLVIGCLIYYDVRQQGSWERSYVNNILNDSGVYGHTQQLYNGARQILLKVDQQIEGNFPTQRRTVIEFSEPYVELLGNLGRIGHNMYTNVKEVVIAQYPAVLKSIESYAPGLMEQSQNAVSTVWSSSVVYFNRGVDYLRKEVFVGQLSPENMQRVVLEAFNTTQIKASEYYHWLYEKVQSTIK